MLAAARSAPFGPFGAGPPAPGAREFQPGNAVHSSFGSIPRVLVVVPSKANGLGDDDDSDGDDELIQEAIDLASEAELIHEELAEE